MRKFIFLILLFLLNVSAITYAQVVMSGNYTVGGVDPDFATVEDAAIAVSLSTVIAPVTISIRPGIYYDWMRILPYAGADSTRRVTFRSETGKASDVIIMYNGPTNSEPKPGTKPIDTNAVFMLQSARFYVFEYLTVRNYTAFYPGCFQFAENSDYNIIRHCVLETDSNRYGQCIGTDGNLVPSGQGANANYCTFESNTFIGSYGIYLYGANENAPDVGNRIINNTFIDMQNSAIKTYSHNIAEVSGNIIRSEKREPQYSTGIEISFSIYDTRIVNNYVEIGTGEGISLFNLSGETKPVLFANNVICGKSRSEINYSSALNIGNCIDLNVFHNTVSISGINDKVSAASFNEGNNNKVRNNIFCHFSGGYAYNVGTATAISVSDNNNYYTTGPKYAKWGNTECIDLKRLKTVNSKDINSASVFPGFISATDLRTFNPFINNLGLYQPEVQQDFKGTLRHNSTPDLGAFEFTPKNNDAHILGALPAIPFKGNNIVSFVIKNQGILSLTGKTLQLAYSVDGGNTWSAPESFVLNGLDSLYDVSSYSFTAPWVISGPGDFQLCIKIVDPLAINDQDPVNDILCLAPSCTGLAGEYTVGPGAEFPSVENAMNLLYSCGMALPVTLNIVPGVYNQQILIKGFKRNKNGDYLTIRSATGDASDVVITNLGSEDNTDFGTLQLVGANHIILEHLTIRNTSQLIGAALHLTWKSDSNIIRNCILDVHSEPEDKVYGVYIGKNTLLHNYENYHYGSYNIFEDNIFSGGHTGIALRGGYYEGKYESGFNSIRNNKFLNISEQAIYVLDSRNILIHGNDINMKPVSEMSYGIMMDAIYSDYRITGNKIMNAGYMGIALDQCDAINFGVVANNMIGGEFRRKYASGLWVGYADKVKVYHNSVFMNLPDSNTACFDAGYFASNVDIQNNCAYHAGGGMAFKAVAAAVKLCDNNNWYSTGKYTAYWGTWRKTLEDLQNASGKDTMSIAVDPFFKSISDLHVRNEQLAGKGIMLSGIPEDFDGNLRDTLPTIGADELMLFDLAVTEVLPATAAKGNVSIKATIENRGVRSVSDSLISLSYSTDGGVNWTGPELFQAIGLTESYKKQVFTFSTPWVVSDTLPKTLCVRLNKVLPDPNTTNDTLCRQVCIASYAGGTFTIGGASPSFTNVTEAVNFLKYLAVDGCGIAGPIVFNIRPGIYEERILLDEIKGSGPHATVTFQSETGNASDVKLVSALNTKEDDEVVGLNGSSYIYFRDLTLENLASDHASGFSLSGAASNNVIEGCEIILNSQSTSENLRGIWINNEKGISGPSHHINIENNKINGGFRGIQLKGNGFTNPDEDISLISNTISETYDIGIYAESGASLTCSGNKVNMRNTNPLSAGIYLAGCSGDLQILSNQVNHAGYAGIYLQKVQSSSASLIANNMIGGNFRTVLDGYGIYLADSRKIDILFNSVQYNKNESTNSGSLYAEPDNRQITLFNNIFSNTGGGYACYIGDSVSVTASDYNDFYSTGEKLAYWNQDHLNLAELKTFSGKDQFSVSINPAFVSASDLHTFNSLLDGKGIPDSRVKKDFDGDVRHQDLPDIGADEFVIGKDAGVIAFNNLPDVIVVNTVQQIQVDVKNFGNELISNFDVRYEVNTIPQATESHTAPIASGITASHTFITNFTPILTGTYQLKAYTMLPGDLMPENDAITKEVLVINEPLGLQEGNASMVNIFPNPAGEFVFISLPLSFGKTRIDLFDLSGRLLRSVLIEEKAHQFDLSGLAVGNYFLKLHNKDQISYHKIMIFK